MGRSICWMAWTVPGLVSPGLTSSLLFSILNVGFRAIILTFHMNNRSIMSSADSANESTASMLHGHAAYVAGAAKETFGNLTGSEPWQEAGRDDKAAAVDEMRTAKDASGSDTTRNPTVGKLEKALGESVGCEGMAEEGAKSSEDPSVL